MTSPMRRALYLTAEQAHEVIPGRSMRWVYDHMRLAGGRNGMVSAEAWYKHLEEECSSESGAQSGTCAARSAANVSSSAQVLPIAPRRKPGAADSSKTSPTRRLRLVTPRKKPRSE